MSYIHKNIANIIIVCYYAIGDDMATVNKFRKEHFSCRHSLNAMPDPHDFFLHTHDNYELYCFVSGRAIYTIEGTDYHLRSGDILVIAQGESHTIKVDPTIPYERVVFNFDKTFIAQLDPELTLLDVFDKREAGKLNLYSFSELTKEGWQPTLSHFTEPSNWNDLTLTTSFFSLLDALRMTKHQNLSDVNASDTLVNKVTRYINDNLQENLSLELLCKHFYVSKPQLCRIFKQAMGTTVWEYITVKRVVKAHGLICSGMPPTQAYIACGFRDYSVFFRAYKKRYQVSPRAIHK